MRKGFQYIYTLWCVFWLVSIFLLLFPIVFICLQRESWKPTAHRCNWIWGQIFFRIIGMPLRVQYDFVPDPNKTYVFCANHFSYLDVAVMQALLKNYFAFVGKSSVKKVPLLGYMFAKLHIQVTREEKNSRVKALNRSMKAVKEGRSVVVFPEGGIKIDMKADYKTPPQMILPLKEGAFSMAIEHQVPIVPITFLNNYKAMPEHLFVWQPSINIIIHQPIDTKGKTREDVKNLQEEFYTVVNKQLAPS